MNLVWAALTIVVATAVAVGVMLLVRRRAPDGGYFNDGDRAAGVFGVIATAFSVLLGFVIFLSFSSYDASRAGAEEEAVIVAQQVETAQLLPENVRADLTGQLVCYGRWVVGPEWDRMEDGTLGEEINPWGADLFRTIETVELDTPNEEAAFGKWLDQTSDRERARQDRVHGAAGVMPLPLWIGLFFLSALVAAYVIGFADSGERAPIQALLMGSVVAVIVAMLLVLNFLDDPFHDGVGGLQPKAMQRSLIVVDEELGAISVDFPIPCDAAGRPRR